MMHVTLIQRLFTSFTALIIIATLSPLEAHAMCSLSPDSLTLVDERLEKTPVTWVCADNDQGYLEALQAECDVAEPQPDLSLCPLTTQEDLIAQLADLNGAEVAVGELHCDLFVDCKILNELVPPEEYSQWPVCGLEKAEKVLSNGNITEFITPGDMARTRGRCGSPDWSKSELLDAEDLSQVKVLMAQNRCSGVISGHELYTKRVGEPCCESPYFQSVEWANDGDLFASALSFVVDGADEWIGAPGQRHVCPDTGLAIDFHYSVYAKDNEAIEDFNDFERCEVYAWAPTGFVDGGAEDWCPMWCEELIIPDEHPDEDWVCDGAHYESDLVSEDSFISSDKDLECCNKEAKTQEPDSDAAQAELQQQDAVIGDTSSAEAPKKSEAGCSAGAAHGDFNVMWLFMLLVLAIGVCRKTAVQGSK
jgi:hypothetical protein